MTIEDIAYRINDISINNHSLFSTLQEIRRNNGISPRTKKPFAEFSIKEGYAFHAGGRKELQFNIAEEDDWEDGSIFRYGIAFSLNEDKTLHDSKAEFRPIIRRFNSFLIDNPTFFDGFKMWYYSNRKFTEYFEEVRPVEGKLFKAENFIFIGKYFKKGTSDINESDINKIIVSFDYLIPLYEKVQFENKSIEKRLARICWNDYGWVMPSGFSGKSSNPESHEGKYGYGHEEWLFDVGKLIDGYHYGFLEPIRKHQEAYAERVFNVWVYAINGISSKRFWIGIINRLEVLSKDQAGAIKEIYIKNGWFTEMEEQIKISGANERGFSDWKGVDLFNIRFLPSDLHLNDTYLEVPVGHSLNSQTRYSFSHYGENLHLEEGETMDFLFVENTGSGKGKSEVQHSGYLRTPKAVELTFLHRDIREKLTLKLQSVYGFKNVTPEHPAGYGGNRIDIIVNDNGRYIFYEIKTYTNLKTSIREAFGQLMEYAHWTNHRRSNELIIVSHILATDQVKIYFKHLRDTFKINIFYQSFDLEMDLLSEKW